MRYENTYNAILLSVKAARLMRRRLLGYRKDIMNVIERARAAKHASIRMGALETDTKNRALEIVSRTLSERAEEIFQANRQDLERAEKEGVAAPLVKRLKFDASKLAEVQDGISSTIALPDPVARVISSMELDEGLVLVRRSCSLGVIGMIFESRPDALVQIATLCLKSGNAVMLKGGREAQETNRVLTALIADAAEEAGLPAGWITLIESRAEVGQLLDLGAYIDLIIPRGSNEFVRYIMEHTSIPVLGHADGICHAYVDRGADIEKSVRIVVDAKTQYVAVCNAIETLLVNEDIAPAFLPPVQTALRAKNVELRGCARTREILPGILPATDEDWETEYLDYIISIKVVDSLDDAIDHINEHGSHHTDLILTTEKKHAAVFMDLVDSASVMWNCSTRFADGFRYGLGAEVGISTSKIHARGPVGLEGLVSYKWRLSGDGHVVEDYSGNGAKSFTHRPLL